MISFCKFPGVCKLEAHMVGYLLALAPNSQDFAFVFSLHGYVLINRLSDVLVACVKHMSLPHDISARVTIAFESPFIFTTLFSSPSVSHKNVLYSIFPRCLDQLHEAVSLTVLSHLSH